MIPTTVPAIFATQTPPDALSSAENVDVISTSEARTLDELFRERVRRCPEQTAYRQYDAVSKSWLSWTWADVALQVERWQVAFREQGLVKGDRVAICFQNSVEWVIFDQAALRLGLVVVPLYTADRPDNMAYLIADSRAKLVLLEKATLWSKLLESEQDLSCIQTVLVFAETELHNAGERVIAVEAWLPEHGQHLERGCTEPNDLASIVYTSGTTGRPKGVMLSHKNMLSNAYAGLRSVPVKSRARVLSFLPLSHTLERTVGYYTSVMAGAVVSFNRSIDELAEDLRSVKPNVLVSVPRIFERIHNQIFQDLETGSKLKTSLFRLALKVGWCRFEYQQQRRPWHPSLLAAPILDRLVGQVIRDKLGGELEMVVVGGAPLAHQVAKTFISLGIPLLQGYGLTESSPVISVNTLKRNKPESIGLPLRGVEVKIIDNDELCARGENIMLGYWGMPEATAKAMQDGWLKTGDRAAIDDDGFLRIIGRIKDILVLANGEKVPPTDIETAILDDSIFEQVMIIGEAKSYLSALVVLSETDWPKLAAQQGWSNSDRNSTAVRNELLTRISLQMDNFPGYAKVRKVFVCDEDWTIENGLLTPTLKMKRTNILEHYAADVEALYAQNTIRSAE